MEMQLLVGVQLAVRLPTPRSPPRTARSRFVNDGKLLFRLRRVRRSQRRCPILVFDICLHRIVVLCTRVILLHALNCHTLRHAVSEQFAPEAPHEAGLEACDEAEEVPFEAEPEPGDGVDKKEDDSGDDDPAWEDARLWAKLAGGECSSKSSESD